MTVVSGLCSSFHVSQITGKCFRLEIPSLTLPSAVVKKEDLSSFHFTHLAGGPNKQNEAGLNDRF